MQALALFLATKGSLAGALPSTQYRSHERMGQWPRLPVRRERVAALQNAVQGATACGSGNGCAACRSVQSCFAPRSAFAVGIVAVIDVHPPPMDKHSDTRRAYEQLDEHPGADRESPM